MISAFVDDEVTAFWLILTLTYATLAIITSGHALISRPTPRSTLVWLYSILFLPLIGMILYATLGHDRVRRRALLKGRTKAALRRSYSSVSALESVPKSFGIQHSGSATSIHRLAERLSRRPLLIGNQIRLLRNGEEAYPEMLQAIQAAQQSINLQTYLLEEDSVGQDFIDHLAAASARGVAVRVLYDAAGSLGTSKAFLSSALERGLQIEPFFPLNPLERRAQINLRNHRKLLVVDGQLGFIGGMNISHVHLANDLENPARCRDLHLLVKGPVVQQLQEVFAEDWYYAVGEDLVHQSFFPALNAEGDAIARIIPSGPDDDYEHIYMVLFSAAAAARESIQLVTPYFLPDTPFTMALRSAALRGVQVEIFIPGTSDIPIIRRATFANLTPLLESGVKVWEHPPPFVHTKAYLFDKTLAFMGSPNLDARGFRLNYEVAIEVSNTPMITELISWIEQSRQVCKAVTAGALRKRPLHTKLLDHFWNLFSPSM